MFDELVKVEVLYGDNLRSFAILQIDGRDMFLLIGRICVGRRSAGVECFGAGSCSLIAWGGSLYGFKHRVVASVGGGFSGGLRDLGGGCGVFWRGVMLSDCGRRGSLCGASTELLCLCEVWIFWRFAGFGWRMWSVWA